MRVYLFLAVEPEEIFDILMNATINYLALPTFYLRHACTKHECSMIVYAGGPDLLSLAISSQSLKSENLEISKIYLKKPLGFWSQTWKFIKMSPKKDNPAQTIVVGIFSPL